jgi:hypothetical protein
MSALEDGTEMRAQEGEGVWDEGEGNGPGKDEKTSTLYPKGVDRDSRVGGWVEA